MGLFEEKHGLLMNMLDRKDDKIAFLKLTTQKRPRQLKWNRSVHYVTRLCSTVSGISSSTLSVVSEMNQQSVSSLN